MMRETARIQQPLPISASAERVDTQNTEQYQKNTVNPVYVVAD